MTSEEMVIFLREFWLLYLFVGFVGIVAWVMRPRARERYESYGRIPLDED